MKKCWMDDPNNRPRFAIIRSKLDQTLEEMAGYLSMGLDIFPDIHQEQSSLPNELDLDPRNAENHRGTHI